MEQLDKRISLQVEIYRRHYQICMERLRQELGIFKERLDSQRQRYTLQDFNVENFGNIVREYLYGKTKIGMNYSTEEFASFNHRIQWHNNKDWVGQYICGYDPYKEGLNLPILTVYIPSYRIRTFY